MSAKGFDLNIEKVLENWDLSHALREIIANALDEQILTNTESVKIFEDSQGTWHIRDYGRGLRYSHLTQNENEEKLSAPNLIGKFGVGLKDALATFNRHKVSVTIQSAHGHFTFGEMQKTGFDDVVTLHAFIQEPINPQFIGTEFLINGCSHQDMEVAKSMFLCFSNMNLLEATPIGEVYQNNSAAAKIYINGVLVAHEENFMFSYNITSLTAQIKKALNRERTNVGRTAYTGRVKEILLRCTSPNVFRPLANEMSNYGTGNQKDELQWKDVSLHAAKALGSISNVVFISSTQLATMPPQQREILEQSGKELIVVPDNLMSKLGTLKDFKGNPISTPDSVFEEYREGFSYHFINQHELTRKEQRIFSTKDSALMFMGAGNLKSKIAISETIRPTYNGDDTLGEWDSSTQRIVIRRDQLQSLEQFLGTLLHEVVHAQTGTHDITREFENELTKCMGLLAGRLFETQKKKWFWQK